MKINRLMLFGIFMLALSQLLGGLAELNKDGGLSGWMEAVVAHPAFKIAFLIFAALCMIAMPYFFIRAKKNPY